jgi:hypothetical protein
MRVESVNLPTVKLSESSMRKTVEQAKQDLLAALPHFRYSTAEAKKNGAVKLGILCEYQDGTKKLEVSFACDEFFEDLALVLGAPAQSQEDNLKASARQFVQQHGIQSE